MVGWEAAESQCTQRTADCDITRHSLVTLRHGGDDAEDDEPPGLGAEYAQCGGGQGGQPEQGGEAGAGARQQGGDGQGREGEEAEVPQGAGGESEVMSEMLHKSHRSAKANSRVILFNVNQEHLNALYLKVSLLQYCIRFGMERGTR